VTPDVPAELEQRYRLRRVGPQGDDQPGPRFRYELVDFSPANLAALVRDPRVVDTDEIERKTGQLRSPPSEPLWVTWQRTIPLLRLQIAPGIFRSGNAILWLYCLFVSLPPLALLVLVGKRLRLWAGPSMAGEAPKILSTIALCAAAQPALLRDPSSAYRLADGAAIAVLLAWLAGQWLTGRRSAAAPPPGPGPSPRPAGSPPSGPAMAGTAARAGVVLGLLGITWMAVVEAFHPEIHFNRARLADGPGAVAERASQVLDSLRTSPPIDAWDSSKLVGAQALLRYVHVCTRPTDRLLVTWFAPDYYFDSGRGFAGGQIFWFPGYYTSPADQQRTLERLRRQSVPIVISEARRHEQFAAQFRLIDDYLKNNYRVAGESPYGDDRSVFRVLVDSRVAPTATYEPLSLPCYA